MYIMDYNVTNGITRWLIVSKRDYMLSCKSIHMEPFSTKRYEFFSFYSDHCIPVKIHDVFNVQMTVLVVRWPIKTKFTLKSVK